MGRLAGFSVRETTKRLRAFGFEFARQGAGSHEIWCNTQTEQVITLPRHTGDIPEGTLRTILRQAGISADDFLIGKPKP
jgi:predicted RNA binding protein YcfA (HicA-like mRNA interferase family)